MEAFGAIDRALRLADKRSFPCDRSKWLAERDAVYEAVMRQGWNHDRKSFAQTLGGNALDGPSQTYTYFLVAQNGSFLIKQRNGEQTSDIKAATPNAAIKTPDNSGKSVNALEVRVAGDTISYVVNGTVVHTTPKSAVKSDGIAGFRVNHVTEVMVDGFEVQKG